MTSPLNVILKPLMIYHNAENVSVDASGRLSAYVFRTKENGIITFQRHCIFRYERLEKPKKGQLPKIIYDVYDSEKTDGVMTEKHVGESYIELDEVELIDHVLMNHAAFRAHTIGDPKKSDLLTQPASDVSIRLHFLIKGDIYEDYEMVFYKGAGCQATSNFVIVD